MLDILHSEDHSGISLQAKTRPYLSIHPSCTMQFIPFQPAPILWSLLSRSYIYRLSLEVYTNRETKVPLGNGPSRNADLGTASGTGPTHGHSLISFGLN